jgi:hypothetical protein
MNPSNGSVGENRIGMEEGFYFLELKAQGITIRIPDHVWAVMRSAPDGAVSFDVETKTDKELLALVERQVEERIKKYGKEKGLLSFAGAGIYGQTTLPKKDQIQHGMKWHIQRRAQQRALRARMSKLSTAQTYALAEKLAPKPKGKGPPRPTKRGA